MACSALLKLGDITEFLKGSAGIKLTKKITKHYNWTSSGKMNINNKVIKQ